MEHPASNVGLMLPAIRYIGVLTHDNQKSFFKKCQIGDVFTYDFSLLYKDVLDIVSKNGLQVIQKGDDEKALGMPMFSINGQKVHLINWFGGDSLQKVGYNHGDEKVMTQSEIMGLVNQCFNVGLNVMLKRHSDGYIVLAVSTGGFGQMG